MLGEAALEKAKRQKKKKGGSPGMFFLVSGRGGKGVSVQGRAGPTHVRLVHAPAEVA